MKSLIFATVALVVIGGAGLLVAQNEDHALRLWLIDRIERAYVDGDAEALRRMAKHEYEHDIGEWLKRQPIGTTGAVSDDGRHGPCRNDQDCMSDQYCSNASCTKLPEIPLPDDLPPVEIPPPPPPPPVPDLCALAWQTVASCIVQERVVCTLADDNPDEPALARLCADQRRECARLTVLAIRLCADPNRPLGVAVGYPAARVSGQDDDGFRSAPRRASVVGRTAFVGLRQFHDGATAAFACHRLCGAIPQRVPGSLPAGALLDRLPGR